MIRLVEALNFRCLRYVHEPMDSFHVLVGPNASGKTTFLDTVAFLADLVSGGIERALEERTQDFRDLVWDRADRCFELAVELQIPEEKRKLLAKPSWSVARYEVGVGTDSETGAVSILAEKVLLRTHRKIETAQRTLFPVEPSPPDSILSSKIRKGTKTIVNKIQGGNDNFYHETPKGFDHVFKLGPRKSALGNVPEDESKFPVATWLKKSLNEGVQRLVLNSALMRKSSPPGQPKGFRPDGSNLPWVVAALKEKHPDRHADWVEHLRTALPDLEDVRTVEREEDRHRYLMLCYRNDLAVPSWMASDGTLRLLALTLPAYLPDLEGVFLIEEPENGIHPQAVETMFQSLSSVYGAQILLATHSPVILSIAESRQVLCFSKTDSGATDIVLGTEHPALREWRGETSLGVLFASGVLG